MDSSTSGVIALTVTALVMWGTLSGGLTGSPRLGRDLRSLWAFCRFVLKYGAFAAIVVGLPLGALYFLVRFIKWSWTE